MFNIDLKSLDGMESHRGIAYMMLITSIFPPSFLALVFLRPESVEEHLIVNVLTASSVGLLSTAAVTAAIFLAVSDPSGKASLMKRLGARSLGIGSALSFLIQGVALCILLVQPSVIPDFATYTKLVAGLVIANACATLVLGYWEQRRQKALESILADAKNSDK